jgi:hypothetical protein
MNQGAMGPLLDLSAAHTPMAARSWNLLQPSVRVNGFRSIPSSSTRQVWLAAIAWDSVSVLLDPEHSRSKPRPWSSRRAEELTRVLARSLRVGHVACIPGHLADEQGLPGSGKWRLNVALPFQRLTLSTGSWTRESSLNMRHACQCSGSIFVQLSKRVSCWPP